MRQYLLVVAFTFIILLFFSIIICQVSKRLPVVELRPSPIHGRGMFATCTISKGHVIEIVPIIKIDRARDITKESVIRNYDIKFGENHAIMLGYGSIYNHSDNNNAYWDFMGEELYVIAERDILNNEEVFVSYGPGYWGPRSDKVESA